MSEQTGVEIAGPQKRKTLWQRIKRQFSFTKEGGNIILWVFRVMFTIWLAGTFASYVWQGFYESAYWITASWVFIAAFYWLIWQWENGSYHKVIKSCFGLLDDFSKLQEHTIRAWDEAVKQRDEALKKVKELEQSRKDLRTHNAKLEAEIAAMKSQSKTSARAKKKPTPKARTRKATQTKAVQ